MTPRAVPSESAAEQTCSLFTRSDELILHRFRLEVIAGPDRGAVHESTGIEATVGSSRRNSLVVNDRTVSRYHCSITVTPSGFVLRDLGSTNGTKLAGFRVETGYLKTGAIVKLGSSQFRFDLVPGELHEALSSEESYSHVLGKSAAMRRIFAVLPRIAASDSTILIEGETGTGKGLLAEVIHRQSPRAKGRFVVVDCSAIPPSLVESELFGHGKGAFTGAESARAGAFEAANGGTIFLDEIGELLPDMQPKLLRALEERVIRRVGTLQSIPLDVRILAATNRDLHHEVNRGAFRADLFYRLNTVRLRVPPLRDRPEDIPLLATHFYRQFADDGAEPPAELLAELALQPWPGNVRELRGAIERAVLFGDQDQEPWSVSSAPGPAPSSRPEPEGKQEMNLSRSFREYKEAEIARWERAYIEALVRANGGNLSKSARAARMDRNHLRELLRRHGVSASEE
jgi:DNA-binding NtrC family response regulator